MSSMLLSYELRNVYTPYEGLDGMLLKLTMWKSKSSRLSYSLVESLPPHKYLMPVMIDFSSQDGARVVQNKAAAGF